VVDLPDERRLRGAGRLREQRAELLVATGALERGDELVDDLEVAGAQVEQLGPQRRGAVLVVQVELGDPRHAADDLHLRVG
jgi:hypothetical protein